MSRTRRRRNGAGGILRRIGSPLSESTQSADPHWEPLPGLRAAPRTRRCPPPRTNLVRGVVNTVRSDVEAAEEWVFEASIERFVLAWAIASI